MKLYDYLKKYNKYDTFWEIEKQLKISRKKNTPWSIEFYTSRGYSIDEGQQLIKDLQQKRKKKLITHPKDIQHWLNKGFNKNIAEIKVNEYRAKIGQNITLKRCIEKYGETKGKERYELYVNKIKNRGKTTLENLQNEGNTCNEAKILYSISKGKRRKPITVWESMVKYRMAVDYITRKVMILYDVPIETSSIKEKLVLDHKFSCYGGWIEKISPYIIASIYNLRFITNFENTQKGQYCSISKEQLLGMYNENIKNEFREGGSIWRMIDAYIK